MKSLCLVGSVSITSGLGAHTGYSNLEYKYVNIVNNYTNNFNKAKIDDKVKVLYVDSSKDKYKGCDSGICEVQNNDKAKKNTWYTMDRDIYVIDDITEKYKNKGDFLEKNSIAIINVMFTGNLWNSVENWTYSGGKEVNFSSRTFKFNISGNDFVKEVLLDTDSNHKSNETIKMSIKEEWDSKKENNFRLKIRMQAMVTWKAGSVHNHAAIIKTGSSNVQFYPKDSPINNKKFGTTFGSATLTTNPTGSSSLEYGSLALILSFFVPKSSEIFFSNVLLYGLSIEINASTIETYQYMESLTYIGGSVFNSSLSDIVGSFNPNPTKPKVERIQVNNTAYYKTTSHSGDWDTTNSQILQGPIIQKKIPLFGAVSVGYIYD